MKQTGETPSSSLFIIFLNKTDVFIEKITVLSSMVAISKNGKVGFIIQLNYITVGL